MKLKKYRRIARVMVQAYPTRCIFDVERDIKAYRELKGPDWEGHRAQFQQIMSAAISQRHSKCRG